MSNNATNLILYYQRTGLALAVALGQNIISFFILDVFYMYSTCTASTRFLILQQSLFLYISLGGLACLITVS